MGSLEKMVKTAKMVRKVKMASKVLRAHKEYLACPVFQDRQDRQHL
jgi:hypothetical protein